EDRVEPLGGPDAQDHGAKWLSGNVANGGTYEEDRSTLPEPAGEISRGNCRWNDLRKRGPRPDGLCGKGSERAQRRIGHAIETTRRDDGSRPVEQRHTFEVRGLQQRCEARLHACYRRRVD